MKVLFKLLNNQTFQLDLDEDMSILDVKKSIEAHDSDRFTLANLKLITAGNIMKDDKTLKDYNVTERSFIVCMCSKPKVSVAAAPAPPPPLPVVSNRPVVQGRADMADEQEANSDYFVNTDERSVLVDRLTDMGFERSKVKRALAASFYNPERAVEYLALDTIPDNEPIAQEPTDEERSTVRFSIPEDVLSDPATVLSRLANQPDFAQLRQAVQANPELLNSLVSQIGSQHPELLQIIESNPMQFLEMLNADESAAAATADTAPATQIQLNDRDRAAINRLKDLGYSEMACLQAYFACDKNEEAAANLLLESDIDDGGTH